MARRFVFGMVLSPNTTLVTGALLENIDTLLQHHESRGCSTASRASR